MDESRVAGLLDDVLGSDQTELTSEQVEDFGGRSAVIDYALR